MEKNTTEKFNESVMNHGAWIMTAAGALIVGSQISMQLNHPESQEANGAITAVTLLIAAYLAAETFIESQAKRKTAVIAATVVIMAAFLVFRGFFMDHAIILSMIAMVIMILSAGMRKKQGK